jgi:hypothetical protein
MIILGVGFEMLGQIGDPFSEDRNLNFWRTRVAFVAGMFLDKLLLARGRNRHFFSFDIEAIN